LQQAGRSCRESGEKPESGWYLEGRSAQGR
jgi:hypothetical protein